MKHDKKPSDFSGKKVVFFGVGRRLQSLYRPLIASGWQPTFLCDNHPDKHGKEYFGIPCLSPQELSQKKDEVVVILTVEDGASLKRQLEEAGFPHVHDYKEVNVWDHFLQRIELNLVDHCDLNCKNCSHFSNISPKHIIPLEVIKKDLDRLSALAKGRLLTLRLIGGEPLLHPDLLQIIPYARASFPDTRLCLVTNGLKLAKQTTEFWHCCRDNQIEITPTKYPISLDYEKIENLAKEHQVAYRYYGDHPEVLKTSLKFPLDLDGTKNPQASYDLCQQARECAMVAEGRIYLCPVVATSYIFNQKFGDLLKLQEKDCLVLEKVKSLEEITAFLGKPSPFCRYCDVANIHEESAWGLTTGEMEEWLLEK